ncbi:MULTISPECIES: selenocysteine-specific translation elongation factor [unclassified Halanaerobium]|uniref:selenocysteine-specific translation elongation factor n=1 Tax=unclassified Halanaerobium TaxID=2641197 RepID=UPI000DF44E86|nr:MULTISPECIES: selenocysteine-specific translation elongation factor [unclassified Halanaerobium]RCW41356.1 selenocysteine-specific translation elongation factor SelB [Halanaerobium sp. MA284_MarDTE_T2]RCW79869.1 selenocysteine-specific translation elongation factor SelB [Halanaerobium sp. DL-01]
MREKNIIIGTAGHIDHGKTTLIKALTGADTDRLQQEKDRGISIELGFTGFTLEDGNQIGIIDVPGHEKFVKNMLAGASGIDLALLVVAADEGMMPQSDEHLAILDLLGVKHGIIVLTKIDKVDSDWLELVIEDTKEKTVDTFLDGAPVVPVSSTEGVGIDDLKSEIQKMVEKIPEKDSEGNVYYPIDRVFTMKGFGTIVTGTLFSGSIEVEDELEIYPERKKARVRSLQVHNSKVEKVFPGQRVGINLAGIDKNEINRGDVLAAPSSLIKTKFFEAHLKLLTGLSFLVKHGDRIRFHIGAQEVLGRIFLFDREELLPGEDAYVQFRLEEELVAHFGERFVLRRYSPMTTIGGGKIIEIDPPPRKGNYKKALEELKTMENADPEKRVEILIKNRKKEAVEKKYLLKRTTLAEKKLEQCLNSLSKKGVIKKLSDTQNSTWIHIDNLYNAEKELLSLISDYHKSRKLKKGIKKEELRSQSEYYFDKQEFSRVLNWMKKNQKIKEQENIISLKDFSISLSEKEKNIKEDIITIFKNNLFNPPAVEDIVENYGNSEQAADIIQYLVDSGELIRLAQNIYFHQSALEKAFNKLNEYFAEHESIELSEFRDLIESTRKFSLPLLEEFDRQKITQRRGDKRFPNKKLLN